ncbi:DUF4166 domain-containing protein [Bradyrhizobium sp. DASA03068]|uniref:DUF4166 domain-containing protein n=1 Tax=Bradyrhizobium sp. BLXBL-01 TaxID=3395915 RepID=UPI003F6F5A2F
MTSARLSGSNASTSAHTRLLDDRRFRALLSDEDWGRLPLATWRRFSKRVADGDSVVYVGVVDELAFSDVGWWFAQAARLIGGPLPTGRDIGVPMIVTVTEDGATGGQTWTRICARKRGFPQVIHSAKRFAGPTGLEEYVGFGVSMALRIAVEDQVLIFRSAGYGLQLGRLWLPLPRWLTPGELIVTHRDLGEGAFRFTLDVTHPRHGALIHQSVLFREAVS